MGGHAALGKRPSIYFALAGFPKPCQGTCLGWVLQTRQANKLAHAPNATPNAAQTYMASPERQEYKQERNKLMAHLLVFLRLSSINLDELSLPSTACFLAY